MMTNVRIPTDSIIVTLIYILDIYTVYNIRYRLSKMNRFKSVCPQHVCTIAVYRYINALNDKADTRNDMHSTDIYYHGKEQCYWPVDKTVFYSNCLCFLYRRRHEFRNRLG